MPQSHRPQMAEHGVCATRENRREPASFFAHTRVANCEHLAMKAMESVGLQATREPAPVDA